MCMCRVISWLVENGCLLWPLCSLNIILLAFALLHFVPQGQTCLLLQVSLDFLVFHSNPLLWKGHLFPGVSSKRSVFLGSSDSKESAYNSGDLGLIPGCGRPLEKRMETRSSILAWRIPWTEEHSWLQSVGLQRVRHDWAAQCSTAKYIYTGWIGEPSSEPVNVNLFGKRVFADVISW